MCVGDCFLSRTNSVNNERNGIIRPAQSRKAASEAKKDTVATNARPFKLVTLFASVVLMLAFVGLARADEPTNSSDPVSAFPEVSVESQKRIETITEKTQFHREQSDWYGHKMRKHLPAAHGPLAPVASVPVAQKRLHTWVSVHKRMRLEYKQWQLAQMCKGPRPLLPATITVKHKRASLHQRKVLTEALNTAHQRRQIRFKTYQALVAGITQESTAHNKPAGHGSSVGVLQLIDSHGTVAWRLHIPNSVNWFLNGVIPDDRANPSLPLTVLIQRQQGSAHPDAYAQWAGEAAQTVKVFLGPCHR